MTGIRLLLFGIATVAALAPTSAIATEAAYEWPLALALTLEPVSASGSVVPAAPHRVRAGLEARFGVSTAIVAHFTASPDLQVSPASVTIGDLAAGASTSIDLTVTPGSGKPDAAGTWVRMRVEFLPDYQALETEFQDPGRYPADFERERMLRTVIQNRQTGRRQTAVTDHRYPAAGAGRP